MQNVGVGQDTEVMLLLVVLDWTLMSFGALHVVPLKRVTRPLGAAARIGDI